MFSTHGTAKKLYHVNFEIKNANHLFFIEYILSLPFRGNHTVYFSSSFYIINQKPMIPTTDFHFITTWFERSSG